jgi:hypothetical protein
MDIAVLQVVWAKWDEAGKKDDGNYNDDDDDEDEEAEERELGISRLAGLDLRPDFRFWFWGVEQPLSRNGLRVGPTH